MKHGRWSADSPRRPQSDGHSAHRLSRLLPADAGDPGQSRLSVSCRTARNAGLLLLASSAERALRTTDAIVSSLAPRLPLHLGDGDARPRAWGHPTVVGLDPA